MTQMSLTKTIMSARWAEPGNLIAIDGQSVRAIEVDLLPAGQFESGLEGPLSDSFYQKVSELLSRLPSLVSGQLILLRRFESEASKRLITNLLAFEPQKKVGAFSHLEALLQELGFFSQPISQESFLGYQSLLFGKGVLTGTLPDLSVEQTGIAIGSDRVQVLSLTELPQMTWQGCFQSVFEHTDEFIFSIKFTLPDRQKTKRQLDTKRRVSHALSVSSSLEVKNIESNSVLGSSEETLERILVGKETLFEISVAIFLKGDVERLQTVTTSLERALSGIANAGIFQEGLGCLPVLKAHQPGEQILGIRKLPILSGNLSHLLPLTLDYSRVHEASSLKLVSRCGEVSNLNLFSSGNLNHNAFIAGASGSGKSFLMNAILSSALQDESKTRICIFDIGGSYRKLIESKGGTTHVLTSKEAEALIATFLRLKGCAADGFHRTFIETLCGSNEHISHSHRVAIDDLLREVQGTELRFKELIEESLGRQETFFRDIAHWLKPYTHFDRIIPKKALTEAVQAQVVSFDFKELESDPILQRTTILVLSEMLWRDLKGGRYPRTLIVFDEVWRFFAQSKGFLEEMYRTLRKYRAGIVSITQNLADYGDEAFAKMIFTNSCTKIMLQNGASREYLKETFDLPDSDVERALSVASKKRHFSEFFVLSTGLNQIFRLYPTQEFYQLANTDNIVEQNQKEAM